LGQSTSTLLEVDKPIFIVESVVAQSSYSPVLVFVLICFVMLISTTLVRQFSGRSTRRAPAWDFGYPKQNARMQESAEGMGQPIKHIFKAFIHVKLSSPEASDKNPQYHAQTEDRFWPGLYFPVLRGIVSLARLVSKLQDGRINHYLLYSFVTLLFLLGWTLWQ
jgi:hypothetical protein